MTNSTIQNSDLVVARLVQIFNAKSVEHARKFASEAIIYAQAVAAHLAAPQEQQQMAVPAGWKLVPVEPTDEMMISPFSGAIVQHNMLAIAQKGLRRNWDAMLAAAPAPPSAIGEDAGAPLVAACPACGGSGEVTGLSGGGPDAYEVSANCPHCNGTGGLEDAYRGVVALLASEQKRCLEVSAKLYAASQSAELVAPALPAPTVPQSTPDAAPTTPLMQRDKSPLAIAVKALERLARTPGCGCSFPCRCGGPEWTKAELEGRMDVAEAALSDMRAAIAASADLDIGLLRLAIEQKQAQIKSAEARIAELDGKAAQQPQQGDVYVECRECYNCDHIGLNDADNKLAACHECDWSGLSPKEDHCPGCEKNGAMGAACQKCGSRYVLIADLIIPALAATSPAVDAASVRDAALEDAAKLCDIESNSCSNKADKLARQIRAMKTNKENGNGN